MGYFVSPDSTDVRGTSVNTNSSMSLNGNYVNTASSVANVRGTIVAEVLDLNSHINNEAKAPKDSSYEGPIWSLGEILEIYGLTGCATVLPEIKSASTNPPSTMKSNLEEYWQTFYRGTTTGAEKVKAYACALGLGVLDIGEALIDGFAFFTGIIGGFSVDEVTKGLSVDYAKDALYRKTGTNVDGAFKIGQTVGKILLCVGILAAFGALASFSLPAACGCAVVGLLVGIGLAIDSGVTNLAPLLVNGVREALNFFLIGSGLMHTGEAIAGFFSKITGGFSLRNFATFIGEKFNLSTIKGVMTQQLDDFKRGKLQYILKTVFKWDVKKIEQGGAVMIEAIVTHIYKFSFKVIDIISAFITSVGTGAKSLWGFIVKSGFSFGEKLTGIDDVLGLVDSFFINLFSGKGLGTVSDVFEAFIGSLPKFVGWLFTIPEVSAV